MIDLTSELSLNKIVHRLCIFLVAISFCVISTAAQSDSIGADYAFLTLMTLEPEFSAARYTIDNENDDQVDIRILRLPYIQNLTKNESSQLNLELAFGHQRAHQSFHLLPAYRDEYIDAYWTTNGISLGLLYAQKLTPRLSFTPSIRLGAAEMKNTAYYYGTFTNAIKDSLPSDLLGWTTKVSVINSTLGLDYRWHILDRLSHVTSSFSHIVASSFREGSAQASFHEKANLINVSADMIFPSHQRIKNKRIDYIVLLGSDYFVGENRHTLGYVISYQIGAGMEIPLQIWQNKPKHLRFNLLGQWASVMRSWTFSLSYTN